MQIVPNPKKLDWHEGAYAFGTKVTLSVNHTFPENRKACLCELWNNFSMTASTLEIVENGLLPAFSAVIGQAEIPALAAEDEYAVCVTPAGVGIAARDELGLMHAMFSLVQVIDPVNLDCGEEVFEIPCLCMHDHASMDFRSIHVCVFPETSLLLLEKTIRLAGLLKCSHIVLEFWGTLMLDSLPEMAWKGRSYSKAQIRPLIDLANSFGMEVVPMTNHLGHATQSRHCAGKHTVLDQNPRLAPLFEPDGWTWCLSNPKTHTLLREIRQELIELCGEGKYFHLGVDEAYSYATCRRCKDKDTVKMLVDYLNGLAEELDQQGRRAFIWGDQFLERKAWDRLYTANGGNHNRDTHLALDQLDRRLIIADWQYRPVEGEVPTGTHFKDKGFTTVLCPWDWEPVGRKNTICLAKAVENQKLDGIMITTWHYLPKMIPFFPHHLEAAWNANAFTAPENASTLIRKLMPKPSRFEESGYFAWEVDSNYHDTILAKLFD